MRPTIWDHDGRRRGLSRRQFVASLTAATTAAAVGGLRGASPVSATRAAGTGAPAPLGVVRSSPSISLVTLDPHNFIGGGLSWLTPVYESLFRIELGDEANVQPLLATDFEVDDLTVTISLRDDVTFTDGTPFNADAVKANLERGKEIGVRIELAAIESVAAVDDVTVEVTLAGPAPGFIADMASIAGFMISPDSLDDPELDRNPVGTGPWIYNGAESTEGEVHIYTLNEDYWNPTAQGLERIEVYDIPDQQARLNALQTGQLDIAAVGGAALQTVENDPNLALVPIGYLVTFGLPILDREGTVVPALGSREVRQAMSLAIDRDAFVEVVAYGHAVPTIQPAPPGHWAHNDALDEAIVYDPDRARELLAEAGYEDGFEFTIASIPPFQAAIEVLGEFWRDIGIEVTLEPIEPGTLAGRSRTTDFPVTMLNWVTGTDMSLYAPVYLTADATFNPFHAEPDPRILELAEQGASTTDLDERAPAYHEIAEIIAEDLPVIYVQSVERAIGAISAFADNPTVRFNAGQAEAPIWHGLRIDG